jgi:hypothetical protein
VVVIPVEPGAVEPGAVEPVADVVEPVDIGAVDASSSERQPRRERMAASAAMSTSPRAGNGSVRCRRQG